MSISPEEYLRTMHATYGAPKFQEEMKHRTRLHKCGLESCALYRIVRGVKFDNIAVLLIRKMIGLFISSTAEYLSMICQVHGLMYVQHATDMICLIRRGQSVQLKLLLA
jgi:hypothetical protein